jgi:hypothetical protein
LLIKEFKRLKNEESQQKSLEWNLQRTCPNYDFQMIYLMNMISSEKIIKINQITLKSQFRQCQGLPQSERLVQLNATAITQMRSLVANKNFKMLK